MKGGLLSYYENVYSRGNINQTHGFGGVMVGVLAASAVDRGFEPRSDETKDYKLVFVALRRKSKDWMAQNQNNVSEWSDISTRGMLFQ